MSGVKVTRIATTGEPLASGSTLSASYTGDEADITTGLPVDGLVDVNAPAPADGDVLTWDDGASEWIAAPGGGGLDTSLVTVAATGATETVDVSVARNYDLTLTADCTLTLTGAVTAEAWFVTLLIRQDGTGGWDVTWPASVEWATGGAPTIDPAINALTVVTLGTVDGGTVWLGFPTGGGTGTDAELNIEGGQSVIKSHGAMGATETFDPTDGNVHTGTLDADCTFTLNAPTGTGACTLELRLTQDGTGGWDITWPGSVTLLGTLDTTASTTSIVIAETLDGGTSWIAVVVGSGGTPATTVTDETTWGITPAVGSDTEYARQDHTHGTPAEPAGTGELLVADVPLEFPHATFFALADQTVGSTTTAYAVAFDGEGDVDGLTHSTVTNNSRITIQQSGEYSLIVSAVATITGGANYHAEMWIAVDGTPVTNSNTILQIPNASTEMVMAVAYNGDLTAGQYVEVMYRGDNTAVKFLYTAAASTPTRPASPAVVLTVNMEAPVAGFVSKGITLLLNDAGDDLLYADT